MRRLEESWNLLLLLLLLLTLLVSSLLFNMSTYIYRVASGISMYFKAFPGGLYAQNKILAKYMLDQKQ